MARVTNEVHNKVKSLVELWKSNGFFESQESNQQIDRMENHAQALLFENRFAKKGSTDLWNELRDKVKSGHMSAFSAAGGLNQLNNESRFSYLFLAFNRVFFS